MKKLILRKRTLFSVIMTIIAVIITNQFWLIFYPMTIELDIKSNSKLSEKCYIEANVSKKNNTEFKVIKIQGQVVNLTPPLYAHVKLNVKRSRFPKRVRFLIYNISENSDICIKNITMKNGKYKLPVEKFKVENAYSQSKNGELNLKPKFNTVILTYPEKINVRTSITFDFKVFIIILILTYLISFKLSDYVADFNTVKGKSKIDILFLVIFFIFLFVPMSHISSEKISQNENRTLAVWKSFINNDGTINYNFGNNISSWFNDRFNLRQFFLDCYDKRMFLTENWRTKDVIKGKNGWLFYGGNDSVESYTNSVLFKDSELIRIKSYLDEIDKACKTKNKKFYFVIAPDKHKIYPEYYPDNIKPLKNQSKVFQLIDYLQKNTEVKIIYPKEMLLKHKNEYYLYWKTDTHWNSIGAYYGYLYLMDTIKKDYKNINVYKLHNIVKEKYPGDLYKLTPSIIRKEDTTLYSKENINLKNYCIIPKEEKGDINCNNPNSDISLLVLGDSFSTAMVPYLAETFGKSKFKRSKFTSKEISVKDLDSADVFILESVERNLSALASAHLEAQ